MLWRDVHIRNSGSIVSIALPLCVFLRSVYMVVDAVASFDPGVQFLRILAGYDDGVIFGIRLIAS